MPLKAIVFYLGKDISSPTSSLPQPYGKVAKLVIDTYSFKEPVMPFTKPFCINKNNTNVGIVAITIASI